MYFYSTQNTRNANHLAATAATWNRLSHQKKGELSARNYSVANCHMKHTPTLRNQTCLISIGMLGSIRLPNAKTFVSTGGDYSIGHSSPN